MLRTTSAARRPIALAAAAVLCLAGLVGCGSIEEKAVETAIKKENPDVTNVDVEKDKGLKIESEDGSVAFGNKAELPQGFPSDVPLPKGGTIDTSMTQGEEMVVMLAQPRVTVASEQQRLTAALESAGYEVAASTMNLGGLEGFSLNAVGNGREVNVAFSQPESGDARVVYNVKPSS